jgi:hypothetical protein
MIAKYDPIPKATAPDRVLTLAAKLRTIGLDDDAAFVIAEGEEKGLLAAALATANKTRLEQLADLDEHHKTLNQKAAAVKKAHLHELEAAFDAKLKDPPGPSASLVITVALISSIATSVVAWLIP